MAVFTYEITSRNIFQQTLKDKTGSHLHEQKVT